MGLSPRIIRLRLRASPPSEGLIKPLVTMAGISVLGLAGLRTAALDPLSAMMAAHILLMNAIAPVLVLTLVERLGAGARFLQRGDVLIGASIIQLVLLWGVHAPPVIERLASDGAHLLTQAALFAAALLFWSAVFAQNGAHRWRALLALLITGKLFCLLGILLVFAPRVLYAAFAHGHDGPAFSPMLADQQLAGLMMVVACPLSYVLAAIVIAARWLEEISDDSGRPRARQRQR